LRSVGFLALSLFLKTLLFLMRKTCWYAKYITMFVEGSKGVAFLKMGRTFFLFLRFR